MRRIITVGLDLVVVLLVAATLVLPVGAMVAVANLGTQPPALSEPLPPIQRGDVRPIRTLPLLTEGGAAAAAVIEGDVLTDAAAMRAVADDLARQVFVGGSTVDFWTALLAEDDAYYARGPEGSALAPYPYRYPALDPVLDRLLPTAPSAPTLARLIDLSSVLTLAASAPRYDSGFPEANRGASAAFALLNHVRSTVDNCDLQLSLAFLASADAVPQDDNIAAEFERAYARCPGDPTPLWLLGQFQLGRTYASRFPEWAGQPLGRAELEPRPFTTFARLQRELPASPAGWAGEADAEVWLADRAGELGVEPFTARHRYTHALALYERAAELAADPAARIGAQAGRAKALAGLGHVDEAAAAAQAALDQAPHNGPLQTVRSNYLERAGRWGDAADAIAGDQAAPLELPTGRALAPTSATSIGIDTTRLADLVVGPPPGGASVTVYDYAFVPRYRQDFDLGTVNTWCRTASRLRDLVLAGRAAQAVAELDEDTELLELDGTHFCGGAGGYEDAFESPLSSDSVGPHLGRLAAFAAAEAGHRDDALEWLSRVRGSPYDLSHLYDTRQNMWRFAGDLDKARAVTAEWLTARPDDPLAWERSGEVAFLQHRYADAASALRESLAKSTRKSTVDWVLEHANVILRQGAAEALAGQTDAATATLAAAERAGADAAREAHEIWAEEKVDDDPSYRGTMVIHYARMQLGDLALRAQDFPVAVRAYTAAAETLTGFDFRVEVDRGRPLEDQPHPFLNGAVENNLALALIGQNEGRRAIEVARTAVSRDPESPVFRQMLAYAYQTAGDTATAIEIYRQALASDPTLFPVANDLAVILAGLGRTDEAIAELRRAVGAEPEYALGWFNLGVLLSRPGPTQFLAAQGALGRAGHLDASLRGRKLELAYDRQPYYSGLDLSRPLPPRWQFATAETRSPAAVTAIAVILLIGRLLWSLGLDQAAGAVGEKLLGGRGRWRLGRLVGRPLWPLLAVAATIAVFVVPMVLTPEPPLLDTLVVGVGVLALVGLYLRTRLVAARAVGETTRHYTWPPAIAFGAALGAAGLAFAPVPVAPAPRHRAVRWAAVTALAVVAVALLFLGWLSGAPTTRSLGSAALVMISSALLPTRPFDGAYLSSRVGAVLVSAAMLVASGLLLLGWI